MDSTDLARITPYAAGSLEERFITKILEREDVGHIRWTPRGIYEAVQADHPELYPDSPPKGLLDQFQGPDFLERLANRRMHRRLSQLPGHMLADTVGRRLLDLAFPKLVEQLESGEAFEKRELRMIVKDALTFVSANALTGGLTGDPQAKEKADEKINGITLAEAKKLIARADPERKRIIAQALADAVMAEAAQESASVIDVEAVDA